MTHCRLAIPYEVLVETKTNTVLHRWAEMVSQAGVEWLLKATIPNILHNWKAKQFSGFSVLFKSEALAAKHSLVPY